MDNKASQHFPLETYVHTEPRKDTAGSWGILHRGTSRVIWFLLLILSEECTESLQHLWY